MINANKIVSAMCDNYQTAVNASDSIAYGKLFASDAIRIPPGSEPEYGPDQIAQSEQKDYDVAKWSIKSRPIDALLINDQWIYGIAEVDITTVDYAEGKKNSFKATKTWLLNQEKSGEWRIKRQMWNLKK